MTQPNFEPDHRGVDMVLIPLGHLVLCIIRLPWHCRLPDAEAHPELAGEGIEYHWAAAKAFYHRLPIDQKRSKQKFKDNVRNALATSYLTLQIARRFAKRARTYILVYRYTEQSANKEAPLDPNQAPQDCEQAVLSSTRIQVAS